MTTPGDRPAVSKINRSRPAALILMAVGGLILLISLAFLLRSPTIQSIDPIHQGQKMSDFTLPNLDGNRVSLSDYIGKTVLINTWASWCPPCRAEMPELIEFYEQYRGKDFIVLAVNAGETEATAQKFAEKMGLTFPVLLDSHFHLVDSLGIDSYPTSILVGPDGIIKKIHIGMFLPGDLEKEIAPFIED